MPHLRDASMKRARILFIGRSAWSEHGGIQRFNRRVAGGLASMGGGVRVLMAADRNDQMPSSCQRCHYTGFAGAMPSFALSFVCAAFRSDVLLLGHVNFVPFAALYKLLRPSGKVILFAHGVEVWNDARYRRTRRYEPRLLRWAVDQVAIVSRYSQRLMAKSFALPGDRFSLFPNAVTLPDIPGRSGEFAMAATPPNILVVSRLASSEAEKHVDKVIRALPEVRSAIPTATVTIVGDGTLKAVYESLAVELGVGEAVNFCGFVSEEELKRAYEEARVFALPSSKEGFGIVYLEAWTRGLPVVASTYGAAPEVVSDGVDGYTVDPSDVPLLADRLIALLNDPALAARFALAGWNKVITHYSDDAFRNRLQALCEA